MRPVMKMRIFATVSLLLVTLAVQAAPHTKSELESFYDKAFRAFDAERYDEALKALDQIDARQPDLAESLNLRGVVLMRQGKFDQAEVALRKAISLDPHFWNASFNLAEIPFLRKDWAQARNRFETLMAGPAEKMQPETGQLIQYKILLTFVRQGKENTVDWMLNKFEQAKDSPALYYSNAAIAFQHGNEKEAKEWLTAAKKQYPPSLNKLYAESLYEIGWMEKPAGESRAALEITSSTDRSERMKSDAKANFEKAERAFQQRDLAGAAKLLDLAEEGSPNEPAFANLRGEILMEEKKLDEAETAFKKAVTADPKFREAQYNLAQIPFKKRDYAKARERFEALFATAPGEKNQAAQLIKYNIFMTLLLQGKETEAQQLMDQFKFTGDTPALYYAQSAWEFKHNRPEPAKDWVTSARKIYSPALNIIFADPFYDLGWLSRSESDAGPTTATLAQAEAPPGTGPTPAMRLGQAGSLPAPEVSAVGETPAPVAGTAAITTAAPTAAAITSPAATSPASIPAQTPASSVAVAAATPAVSAAPIVQPTIASSSLTVAKSTPLPVTHPAASAAATAAAAQVRAWSEPTFSERVDGFLNPRTLLVAGFLLAGILLLAWLVVNQFRRSLSTTPLIKSATPLTEPPFSDEEAATNKDRKTPPGSISAGPPKFSLNLQASEPSVRGPVLPTGAITARGSSPGVDESRTTSPNEAAAPVGFASGLVAKSPAEGSLARSETAPLRDKKEVSLVVEEPPAPPVAKEKELATPATPDVVAPGPTTSLIATPSAKPSEVWPPAAAEPPKAEPPPVVEAPLFTESPQAVEPPRAVEPPAPFDIPAELAEMGFLVAARRTNETPAAEPPTPVDEEPLVEEEPVGQGQPIPQLTTAFTPAPVMSELTKPEPESELVLIEPEDSVAVPIAGHEVVQSSIETPSFASKILFTESESVRIQPTPTFKMPETTITPAAPAFRPASSSPTMSVQQPAGSMHTAVQLTFSLEIASMQLTPTFKMSGLALKPTSKVVSMRLAPSQDPQPPMNLQVTFEVARIDLVGGTIGTIRLVPSGREKPAVLTSPSFAISGLELVAGSGAAPVQVTPSHQEQASVHLTAHFQIAAIEFTPLFEISAIVLNSSTRNVFMQLPGSGPSSIDSSPVFHIENVQLNGSDLAMLQVIPGAGSM